MSFFFLNNFDVTLFDGIENDSGELGKVALIVKLSLQIVGFHIAALASSATFVA